VASSDASGTPSTEFRAGRVKRPAAVFVTVPADRLVGEFRRRHQPRAVARLLPPHITVIPPFVRDVAADDALATELAGHFSALPSFSAELVRVGTFARHVWLAPEPRDAFVRLLSSTRARFPDLVRDEDREPVPHLTIGEARKGEPTRRIAQLAEEELAPQLPFRFDVRDVALFEAGPEGWHELRRLELG
jgi:2'-5' RNA ligase